MDNKKKIYHAKSDKMFENPEIDCKELRTREGLGKGPVTYHYFHGSFKGTNVKFMFCFPRKETYKGRFFQHLSPFPGPDEEMAALDKTGEEDFIAFALTHGAAYVESNMGSGAVFGTEQDSTIFYRSSAAVAEYCRVTAQELFGEHRVYGYVYGGSGGGYKTMSCIENTDSWDGAVPYVIGSPVSLPNCLTVAAHGARLLRNCWRKIVDALEPGGSDDMYAGLNDEEKAALKEIASMGFPPRVCIAYGENDDGSLPVLSPVVHEMDPEYFDDFWTKQGYLGTEPDSSAVRDRIHMGTKVLSVGIPDRKADNESSTDARNGTDDAWQKMMTDAGAAYIEVQDVPQGDDLYLMGTDIIFMSGAAKGKRLRLGKIEGKRLIPGMSYGADNFMDIVSMLRPGDAVFLDNSDYIAIQTYHRHQIPEDRSFHAWDQYRDEKGRPLYPQREKVIGYDFTAGGCGSVQDGEIQGKVIVMNNLMDGDFPWQADWYGKKVASVKGKDTDDCFRLWYNDNAPHGDISEGGDTLRVVSYLGMLRQALLDLAAWVEDGKAPTPASGYDLIDNQVILKETAGERGGIQPLVTLTANGSKGIKIKAGEKVVFTAEMTMPEAAGSFEKAEWSFEGEQDYPYESLDVGLKEENGQKSARITAEHIFENPGTYFAVVRVTSNRTQGDFFTRLRNLCRARVVVE